MVEPITENFLFDVLKNKAYSRHESNNYTDSSDGKHYIELVNPVSDNFSAKFSNGEGKDQESLVRDLIAIENVISKRAGLQNQVKFAGITIDAENDKAFQVTSKYEVISGNVGDITQKYSDAVRKISVSSEAELSGLLKDVNLERLLLEGRATGKETSASNTHGLDNIALPAKSPRMMVI